MFGQNVIATMRYYYERIQSWGEHIYIIIVYILYVFIINGVMYKVLFEVINDIKCIKLN